jgi:hypothetical protein
VEKYGMFLPNQLHDIPAYHDLVVTRAS